MYIYIYICQKIVIIFLNGFMIFMTYIITKSLNYGTYRNWTIDMANGIQHLTAILGCAYQYAHNINYFSLYALYVLVL